MKGVRMAVVALVLAIGFTWGVIRIFGVQFSAGGFYPEYSSLNGDPRGTKLLFDSLSRVPGLAVTRNYLPLDYLSTPAAAVLLFGLSPASLDADFLRRIEKLAGRDNRVVLTLEFARGGVIANPAPIERLWHVRLGVDKDQSHAHPFYIAAAEGWTVCERGGSKILAVEHTFGPGSVLLFAEGGAFQNETLISGNRLASVSAAIGSHTRVTFDEVHFGISESGSVVGLARRFHLLGLAAGLAIVFALALWRNLSAFPPPRPARAIEAYAGRTSFEGLVTLLRRHVRSKDLVSACWAEWLKANRHQIPQERAQRAAAIAGAAAQNPLEAVREIQSELHAKGKL